MPSTTPPQALLNADPSPASRDSDGKLDRADMGVIDYSDRALQRLQVRVVRAVSQLPASVGGGAARADGS